MRQPHFLTYRFDNTKYVRFPLGTKVLNNYAYFEDIVDVPKKKDAVEILKFCIAAFVV